MDNILVLAHPVIFFMASAVMSIVISLLSFALYGVVFISLERIFPGVPNQRILRPGLNTDSIYALLIAIYSILNIYVIHYLQTHLYSKADLITAQNEGLPPFTSCPLWLQILLLFVMVDFVQYWLHRLFHKVPLLWNFHAIHHSSQTLDWLSTQRWHPLNHLLYSMLVFDLMYLCGFSPKAMALYITLNGLNAMLLHANLKWTYGPFKYIFASPIFHRWHHTSLEEGGNKNFAPYFSFFDVLFGTFYMPKSLHPTILGVTDFIPNDFLGQCMHPFHKKNSKQRVADDKK